MKKFTEEETQLLDRHYTKIKIFGVTILWWNTSPRAMLEHLQEIKAEMKSKIAETEAKIVPPKIPLSKEEVFKMIYPTSSAHYFGTDRNSYLYQRADKVADEIVKAHQ